MRRINFVLSCVEHGQSFITSGPEKTDIRVRLRTLVSVCHLVWCVMHGHNFSTDIFGYPEKIFVKKSPKLGACI